MKLSPFLRYFETSKLKAVYPELNAPTISPLIKIFVEKLLVPI